MNISTAGYLPEEDEIIFSASAIVGDYSRHIEDCPEITLKKYIREVLLHEYRHAKQRRQIIETKEFADKNIKAKKMDWFYARTAFQCTVEYKAGSSIPTCKERIVRKLTTGIEKEAQDMVLAGLDNPTCFLPIVYSTEELKKYFPEVAQVLIGMKECYKKSGGDDSIDSFKELFQCVYGELIKIEEIKKMVVRESFYEFVKKADEIKRKKEGKVYKKGSRLKQQEFEVEATVSNHKPALKRRVGLGKWEEIKEEKITDYLNYALNPDDIKNKRNPFPTKMYRWASKEEWKNIKEGDRAGGHWSTNLGDFAYMTEYKVLLVTNNLEEEGWVGEAMHTYSKIKKQDILEVYAFNTETDLWERVL